MTQHGITREIKIRICIAILSILGLLACFAGLFPQVRHIIIDLVEQHIVHKKITLYQSWFEMLLSYSMGGICFILFFDYCTLTTSGRILVRSIKQEIKDCLAAIDFRSLVRPTLIILGVYLLGILTIIRADFLYNDDIGRSIEGFRGWYNWSRYVSEFTSIFIHADTNLTDISPLPQLLATIFLSVSSVLLVYVMGNRKTTVISLLASIPLGLSPFFLGCLSFKFDAPYFAMSILLSITPFLFRAYKKTFFFCSVVSLLMMCMTYQAASGIYLLIVVMLCFQDWNYRIKPDKEILSFLWNAALSFCIAMICFKFFFMRHNEYLYDTDAVSSAMHSISQMIPGIWVNIQNYATIVYQDLGLTWKICIALVCFFFVMKSVSTSSRNIFLSFFISVFIISLTFVLSYGIYLLLKYPLYYPRALFGFGAFTAIICVYVVADYKKIATIPVIALSWCFLVFSLSYGSALADQARYAEFRISIIWHDLNAMYPYSDGITMQLNNSIDFTPSIKNVSKHYPIIERLIPKRFGVDVFFDNKYYLDHFNYGNSAIANIPAYTSIDYSDLNLPVVLDTYYHTIQSDGKYILITLKH